MSFQQDNLLLSTETNGRNPMAVPDVKSGQSLEQMDQNLSHHEGGNQNSSSLQGFRSIFPHTGNKTLSDSEGNPHFPPKVDDISAQDADLKPVPAVIIKCCKPSQIFNTVTGNHQISKVVLK